VNLSGTDHGGFKRRYRKMKIRIIKPVLSETLNEITKKEVLLTKAPDTDIDIVNIDKGPLNIECFSEEAFASAYVVEKVVQAEKNGSDGVFITCFADPAVDASRELVKIPVVGGFHPTALTASLISDRWSIVTVSKKVIPLIRSVARKLGVESHITSIRQIDTRFLELTNDRIVEERLLAEIEEAVDEDGAEAIA
jgi:allantoin racemase